MECENSSDDAQKRKGLEVIDIDCVDNSSKRQKERHPNQPQHNQWTDPLLSFGASSNASDGESLSLTAPPLPLDPQCTGVIQSEITQLSQVVPSKVAATRSLKHPDESPINYLRTGNAPERKRPINSSKLLPPLFSEIEEGHRRMIIRGSLKQCVGTKVQDSANEDSTLMVSKVYSALAFLSDISPALDGCTFLLPGLRRKMFHLQQQQSRPIQPSECEINVSSIGSFRLGHVPGYQYTSQNKPTEAELRVAKRRIESAICAFGGSLKPKRKTTLALTTTKATKADKSSIFRLPNEAKSNEKKLRQQYFEHGARLSWEVEANMPISSKGGATFDEDDEKLCSTLSRTSSVESEAGRKNKCKKCGQLQQSHTCPFKPSLLRSIGVMVYPSANAYAADEPSLGTPVCEMNNCILMESNNIGSTEISQVRTAAVFEKKETAVHPAQLISTTVGGATSSGRNTFRRNSLGTTAETFMSQTAETSDDYTSQKEEQTRDLLFQPTMKITPEQFRFVNVRVSSKPSSRDLYSYPTVPLTYAQRKSMSYALFALSKTIPELTNECSLVLSEARKKDKWDLAVAELFAQVICIVHCSPSRDYKLDRLQQYLLSLGITC